MERVMVTVKSTDAYQFPRLKVNRSGEVLLAIGEHANCFYGTIIHGENDENVGMYGERWSKSVFRDFDGEVTLSNEKAD